MGTMRPLTQGRGHQTETIPRGKRGPQTHTECAMTAEGHQGTEKRGNPDNPNASIDTAEQEPVAMTEHQTKEPTARNKPQTRTNNVSAFC